MEPRRWIPGIAAVAALLALALLALPRGDRKAEFAEAIALDPLPVRIQRSASAPDSFSVLRLRGLESYRDGSFRAAGDLFDLALTLRPDDPEMSLYAGSARLLEGDAAQAVVHLESGIKSASSDGLREELVWHLAAARLRLGDLAEAKQALDAVAGMGRSHAEEARRIRGSLP